MTTDCYTTPIGLTSQFFFCGLPLRLDTYRGCAFQCAFCFARQRGGNTPDRFVVPANPHSIRRIFERSLDSQGNRHVGIIGQFLRRRVPIHFGGMSDPFQPIEARHGVTKATLNVLGKCDYPTVISTRGKLVASPPYLDLLKAMKFVVVQFSLSSSRDEIARILEPRSSPPSEILKRMEVLAKNRIPVTCRWQPFVPGSSESPVEFVTRISCTGCSHVSLEHLKVPVERKTSLWREFVQLVGRDPYEEYKVRGAVQDGRELVLRSDQKLNAVIETAAEAHRCGMTFGAADNEFQYLSDTSCCCSGVDRFPGFENYFRHQIGYAVRKCQGRRITYDAIQNEWVPKGSVDRYLNSESRISIRNRGKASIADHIKVKWNQLDAPGSPSSFFGVKPGGKSRSGSGTRAYNWDSHLIGKIARQPENFGL